VHVTDSRHCAGETAHDHTLEEDMHINFPIEDYREEPKRKISESVALKAPMSTLFNMLPGPSVRTPHGVRAPLKPIKGRAHTIEHKIQRLSSSQALGSFKFSQAIQHTVDVGFYAPAA
jgi:hypothetical protein